MSAVVVTPAVQAALTTVANVRADLGLPAGTPADAQIQRWIAQASSRASTFCRRTFGRQIYRERLGWRDLGFEILLDAAPVVSISSVVLDGATLDPAAYELAGGWLYHLNGTDRCCWSGRDLIVTYEAGWLLPGEDRGSPPTTALDLPAEIEAAVIKLVGSAASVAGRDAMVKSESTDGVGSVDWYVQGANAALPHPEAESALAEYRRLVFA